MGRDPRQGPAPCARPECPRRNRSCRSLRSGKRRAFLPRQRAAHRGRAASAARLMRQRAARIRESPEPAFDPRICRYGRLCQCRCRGGQRAQWQAVAAARREQLTGHSRHPRQAVQDHECHEDRRGSKGSRKGWARAWKRRSATPACRRDSKQHTRHQPEGLSRTGVKEYAAPSSRCATGEYPYPSQVRAHLIVIARRLQYPRRCPSPRINRLLRSRQVIAEPPYYKLGLWVLRTIASQLFKGWIHLRNLRKTALTIIPREASTLQKERVQETPLSPKSFDWRPLAL